ncbi:MAG: DUF58 domain-containing protein [Burkholderiales bacterium PBB4]|nr:MAG: DUF58 domain-containing protein [Burkholderiales bacterium PBB4]
MSSPAPENPHSTLGRAMAAARDIAALGGTTPPPLPRRRPPGVPPPMPPPRETPAEAEEKLRSSRARQLLNEGELERFKNLIVFARTLVDSRYQGRHKSPDLGGGGEFSEYLAYEPGHPVQSIDWRVYARSRRLVIRRYRQETDMDVHLLVDSSGSMAYQGGVRDEKGLRVARIAAALAYLMLRQGDKASLTLFADRVLDHLPSGGTRRHLMTSLRTLVQPAHGATGLTDLAASIRECERLIRRRGRLVILSDFLGPEPEEIFDALGPFLHRGFEILMMQITDPDEQTLPLAQLARFVDMETGESIDVEPSEIRSDYERRMKERTAAFASGASRRRIDFTSLDNAAPYREAIESYLGFRAGKNR